MNASQAEEVRDGVDTLTFIRSFSHIFCIRKRYSYMGKGPSLSPEPFIESTSDFPITHVNESLSQHDRQSDNAESESKPYWTRFPRSPELALALGLTPALAAPEAALVRDDAAPLAAPLTTLV